MTEEIKLRTRDWERLLTAEQIERYKTAIGKGYFSSYHGIEWRHNTFFGAFIWKHPGRVKVIDRFKDFLGHSPRWSDITDDNLRDLLEDLAQNYAPNSVKTITAEIKAVLRENGDSHEVPSVGFGKILKAKSVPVKAVYLTDSEIKKVIAWPARRGGERYVQRLFVIECLTGARFGDCKRMSTENIIIDDTPRSGKFLSYVSEKSNILVKVPICKELRPFLALRAEDGQGPADLASINKTIRKMCRECGIDSQVKVFEGGKEKSGPKWKFVSTHTGRRSFATNLSKKGIPVEQISLLMGHMSGNVPNTDMTQRYIVGKMELDKNVMRVFGLYDGNEEEAED